MKDDELNQFANQFINLWQENFAKAIGDQKIIEYMMQMGANMQQFYDKPSPSTASNPFLAGFEQLYRRNNSGNDDGRIAELEQRIKDLEEEIRSSKRSNPKRSKK